MWLIHIPAAAHTHQRLLGEFPGYAKLILHIPEISCPMEIAMVKKAISLHAIYILDIVCKLSNDDGGKQQPACVAVAAEAASAHFRDQSICCKVRTYHF